MRYSVFFCSLLLSFQLAAQAVYKTVDEDGNVTYTDQPPEDDAKPMEMPKISVVKTEAPAPKTPRSTLSNDTGTSANPYGSLTVLEPAVDQTYWGTGGTVVVRLRAGQGLVDGHQVNYYMDGIKAGSTASMMQLFADVPRGEHQVRAEIINGEGAVLASSESVTFHMKQQSQMNPNNPANKKAAANPPPGRGGN
jgi:hypothetical protein